ncbi:odorant receptor 9a-like [Leptopilina heterotoma]|uniref:odorant receptor 9a-like n=1 Tax=Leptopilina heterotoma TaxID=63436 RepID=UPI001CA93494|nr:odorant receptor 9a-like [Leptopilina heterotoma]
MISIISQSKCAEESNNLLMNKICQPRDDFELKILQETSHTCRLYTILYLILINISSLSVLLFPPSRRSNFPLPFKVWTPYNLSCKSLYFFTYIHQGFATTLAASVTSSIESLALILILQICTQYEILVHRLNFISRLTPRNEQDSLTHQCQLKIVKNCVQHHIHILSMGDKLNELFSVVIFVQFFGSMISLSAVIYQLSKLSLADPKSWGLLFLLSTSLTQIYIYCYYGEKITSKSLSIMDKIYEIKWLTIKSRTKRDLILIMIRASRPFKFMGFKIIIMSIETFFQVVKSAYSAYNLLKGF